MGCRFRNVSVRNHVYRRRGHRFFPARLCECCWTKRVGRASQPILRAGSGEAMKLVAVGHSFLSAYNQIKYAAMKRLNPELRLRLVVPSTMELRFGRLVCEIHSGLAPEDVVPLKPWLTSWQQHMTYVHNPLRMAAILREFQPDVI